MEFLYKEVRENQYDEVREMLLEDMETSEEFRWALNITLITGALLLTVGCSYSERIK